MQHSWRWRARDQKLEHNQCNGSGFPTKVTTLVNAELGLPGGASHTEIRLRDSQDTLKPQLLVPVELSSLGPRGLTLGSGSNDLFLYVSEIGVILSILGADSP